MRIVKKSPQCLRPSLKGGEPPANHAHEVAFVLREFSGNLVILDPVPNVLVGIEFRTVAGQKVEVESSIKLRQVRLRRLRPVRGMAVDDEEDVAAFPIHEPVEELTEQFRVHPALGHHETKRSLRRDRADHVARESLPGRSHHRGLSAFRPCRPRMVIAAHRRLIAEIDLRPDPFGVGSQFRGTNFEGQVICRAKICSSNPHRPRAFGGFGCRRMKKRFPAVASGRFLQGGSRVFLGGSGGGACPGRAVSWTEI